MALEVFSLPFNLLHDTIEDYGELDFKRGLSGRLENQHKIKLYMVLGTRLYSLSKPGTTLFRIAQNILVKIRFKFISHGVSLLL